MADKTQKEMLQELHQAVVGIPENPDDNGIIGDVKDIKRKLDEVNGRGKKTEARSKMNSTILLSFIGGSGLGAGITKLLNIW